MKAVIFRKYGPPEVLQIVELEKPTPKDHEVLIKVHATTAHIGDSRIRRSDPFLVRIMFGLIKPKKNLVLGIEMSGVIDAVGKDVQSFQVGDEVFGLTGFGLGGYAEYCCLPAKVIKGKPERKGLICLKPANLSFGEAATVPAGCLTALKNLQQAKLSQGQKILINGASGSLGTFAIQLAKYFGAEVTAVCSGRNHDLVKSLGADHTIDYTQEDFTQGDEQYDVVYDAVMKTKASKCRKILKPKGAFVNNNRNPDIEEKDLVWIKELIESGHLKPVIDRTYPLDEVVEAHRYLDTMRKKGNVILTVVAPDPALA